MLVCYCAKMTSSNNFFGGNFSPQIRYNQELSWCSPAQKSWFIFLLILCSPWQLQQKRSSSVHLKGQTLKQPMWNRCKIQEGCRQGGINDLCPDLSQNLANKLWGCERPTLTLENAQDLLCSIFGFSLFDPTLSWSIHVSLSCSLDSGCRRWWLKVHNPVINYVFSRSMKTDIGFSSICVQSPFLYKV